MQLHNLNSKLDNITELSDDKKVNRKDWLVKILIGLLILAVYLYIPSRGIYQSAKELSSSSKVILSGVKNEDLDQIKKGITQSKTAAESMDGSLNWFFWIRIIPVMGSYYSDAKHFTKAAIYELDAADKIIDLLLPDKTELGLAGNPVPGQDKVAQALKVLEKVLPDLDKVMPDFEKASKEVENIDVSKYPEKFGTSQVRSRLADMKNLIMGIYIVTSKNKPLLELAPQALGQRLPKTYLLLFQNDKEIRPTGGFMTAYAFMKFDNGHISTTASDDIYRLDERLLKICLKKVCPLTPPAQIVKYLPEADGKPRTVWAMRDSNVSPDFLVSAQQFEQMYSLLGDGITFDGIIAIDTQVVEELIAVTGPIDVFGTTYSADMDARCNCPNVIYELEHYAEVASRGEEDRKAVLGTLMQQILTRILGSGPDKLPDFVNAGVKLANDKHILFFMHDNSLQEHLATLNWTGQINNLYKGDYLHINDSNFAGGKSNLYVQEKVTYDININNAGDVVNLLTIEYKNPQPFSIWLNGILRDYVRVYVPLNSKLIASKGSDDPVNTQEDSTLNKMFFDSFITVRPLNSRILSFEYSQPSKFSGKSYKLLIQKQPGARDHHYVIKLNGTIKEAFDLTQDRELNIVLP